VENGKDFFVDLNADFQRSCYGMSLEELVRTPGPVRQTRLPGIETPADDVTHGHHASGRMNIPKELWRLVDALWSASANGGDVQTLLDHDVFGGYAVPDELAQIRNALDCSLDFPLECSPRSYAHALISLLQAFPKPIVPSDLCLAVSHIIYIISILTLTLS
jgi:phosphatidylinositol-bisphosphatase